MPPVTIVCRKGRHALFGVIPLFTKHACPVLLPLMVFALLAFSRPGLPAGDQRLSGQRATIIDADCKTTWDSLKKIVINKLDSLVMIVRDIKSKRHPDTLSKKFLELAHRISSLKTTQCNLELLEMSSQVYSVVFIKADNAGRANEGGTLYSTDKHEIVFSIGDVANFVHETTHGGQYERDEFAFDSTTGYSLCNDLYDEMEAYKAQFAFNPKYFNGYISNFSKAHSFETITTSWVRGLWNSDSDRDTVYSPGSPHSAHIGIVSINVNSVRALVMDAYPEIIDIEECLVSPCSTMRSFPNIKYKDQLPRLK